MSDTQEERELTEVEKAFESIDLEAMTKLAHERKEKVKESEEINIEETPSSAYAMRDSSNFPQEPIAPSVLASAVSEKLKESWDAIPSKTPIMVEELCRSFNECIRLNTNTEEAQTLILSPKTGSGKSVSSKMYVSLLKEHASIIVVYTVEDAIQTCKDINEWSGDNDYARCTYQISEDNKDKPLRVNKHELNKFRCIVISHALFKLANTKEEIKYLSLYYGTKREFILIDERVDLYKTIQFPLVNLEHLSKLFADIKRSLKLDHLGREIEYLNRLKESFESIQELPEITLDFPKDKATKNMEPKKFIPITADLYQEFNLESFDFSYFYKLLDTDKVNLQKIIDPLSLTGSDLNAEMAKKLKTLLNSLSTILKYKFYYFFHSSTHKSPVIMVTKNILNGFGSSVVLDATATVNQLYYDKVIENPDTVQHIKTTNPRRYNNFTIHQCRGLPQGKGSIFKNLTSTDIETSIDIYSNIANSLIENDDDKLLIIAHKDFRELLEKKIFKKSIQFTHWGNHRGKNKWSDCNKILVIGWNYVPTEVHYENYLNAVNGLDYLPNDQFLETKKHYEITQIADDLVQAVNRGAVRNATSVDGDCAESEVYLFYPTTIFGNEVLQQFKDEFEGYKPATWQPEGISEIQKLTKAYANIEIVVEYIERKVKEEGEIKQSEVQRYFDEENNYERLSLGIEQISKSSLNRYISKNVEFEILLNSKGIHRIPINSKSYKFTKITL